MTGATRPGGWAVVAPEPGRRSRRWRSTSVAATKTMPLVEDLPARQKSAKHRPEAVRTLRRLRALA